jgi:hypothetical protein
MISGEYTETHSNSAIVDENSSRLEEKNAVLPVANLETEPANQLEIDGSLEIQSKTTLNQTEECESLSDAGEQLNTSLLNTKELVYAVPSSTNSNTILSLGESDGPIVPSTSENNDNFEVQTVIPSTENSLLEGFVNPSQKDELSVESIEGTVLDRGNHDQMDNSSVLDRSTENIDDHGRTTESEDLLQHDFGDLPPWAAQLKGCERMGDSYRGYVHTEAELDILLSMHKEHTHSSWGTRQSPSSQKPSVRFMWKSQYVPYDGVPFLNSGKYNTWFGDSFPTQYN